MSGIPPISDRQKMFYDAISRAADAGELCPSSKDLAILAGYNGPGGISASLKRMVDRGMLHIDRQRRKCIITVTATGKSTEMAMQAPPARMGRAEPLDHRLPSVRSLQFVDRDPCPVCAVRKDICKGHGRKPIMFVPAALWREVVAA